jgi:ankyrin repeat protein
MAGLRSTVQRLEATLTLHGEHSASVDKSVDKVDHNCRTPLHPASQNGYFAIAVALIGASANKEDKVGLTPLHLAAREDHIEIVRVLIGRDAAVDKMDKYAQTPL